MTNTTTIGRLAEEFVAKDLRSRGFKVLDRNVRTRFYEIDIIAVRDMRLCFIEVKYRKNRHHGDGLEYLTKDKINRLIRASSDWLSSHPEWGDWQWGIDAVGVSGEAPNFTSHYIENITL